MEMMPSQFPMQLKSHSQDKEPYPRQAPVCIIHKQVLFSFRPSAPLNQTCLLLYPLFKNHFFVWRKGIGNTPHLPPNIT